MSKKIYFDIWIKNKKIDDNLIIKNNYINTDSLRITYNKNINKLNTNITILNEYTKMINSFKRNVNEKFNLILSDNTKIYTSNKKLMIDSLTKNKPYEFELFNGTMYFSVAPKNYYDKLFNHVFVYTIE